MKKYLFFVFVAICLMACNQNTPDDTKKGGDASSLHQPTDSASWCPVGKRYVRDLSVSHGYECLFQVVWFRTSDSAILYDSFTPNIYRMDDRILHCSYTIDYPNVPMTFDKNIVTDIFHFTDTLTLYNPSEPWAYILAN